MKDLLEIRQEVWQDNRSMLLEAVSIATVFHDFGKIAKGFQFKLWEAVSGVPLNRRLRMDALRHEVYSFVYWSHLTDGMNDAEVLDLLANITTRQLEKVHDRAQRTCRQLVKRECDLNDMTCFHPENTSHLRTFVGLLILSHHRAPTYLRHQRGDQPPTYHLSVVMHDWGIETYQDRVVADADRKGKPDTKVPRLREYFDRAFPKTDMLVDDRTIRMLHRSAGALKQLGLPSLLAKPAMVALGRNALMIADHMGSEAKRPSAKGQWKTEPMANTFMNPGEPALWADSLALHTRRVYDHVEQAIDALTLQTASYPAIEVSGIPQTVANPPEAAPAPFRWQHTAAAATAKLVAGQSGGFFGAIISDTGRGKTRGGITVMAAAALHDFDPERRRLRCTVGLPLRTLATQFQKEFVSPDGLGFSPQDVALVIGQSHGDVRPSDPAEAAELGYDRELAEETGSEDRPSALGVADVAEAWHEGQGAAPAAPRSGQLPDIVRRKMLQHEMRAEKLGLFFGKPLVIATLDHLMAITQAERSFHLDAAIRVVSSDVIIDEIDLFSQKDISAIVRLAYMVGASGRRFMVTSATAREHMVEELFQAYRQGYAVYAAFNGLPSQVNAVIASHTPNGTLTRARADTVHDLYGDCVRSIEYENNELLHLDGGHDLRIARTSAPISALEDPVEIAGVIENEVRRLHDDNHLVVNEGDHAFRVSIGLVKITRINQLVKIMKAWPEAEDALQASIALHSNLLAGVRNRIETTLGDLLNRKDMDDHQRRLKVFLKQHGLIEGARRKGVRDIRVTVFASPVIETGNDLDFDHGVFDPSGESMTRGLVQGSGRINRHRRELKSRPNVVILARPLVTTTGDHTLSYPGVQMPIKCRSERHDRTIALGEHVEVPRDLGPMLSSSLLGDLDTPAFNQTLVLRGEPDNVSLQAEERVLTELFRKSPSIAEYIRMPAGPVTVNHARLRRFRDSDEEGVEIFRAADGNFYDIEHARPQTWVLDDASRNAHLGMLEDLYELETLLPDGADLLGPVARRNGRLSFQVRDNKHYIFSEVYGLYSVGQGNI
jgi:CRISPR-associated endonuclease/helicase Cas3